MLIFGHRGASAYTPENTFAAFDEAVRLGADVIETDLRLTVDGVLVLLHDDTVDRTTDGHGAVAELPLSEVTRLDAGSWFGAQFARERIPRLDAFVDRYLGRLRLCLEVKAWEAGRPLVRLLRERGLTEHPDVEVTSFSWEGILLLHEALPHLNVGHLTFELDSAAIDRAARAGLAQICPHVSHVTPELTAHTHASGLQVRTWGVQSRADLQRALAAGADGTTLNWPDWRIRA